MGSARGELVAWYPAGAPLTTWLFMPNMPVRAAFL
jgi:hypothetical protein